MNKKVTPLTLRLPDELKEDLEQSAQTNDRSVNKELAARLRDSFDVDFNSELFGRINKELPKQKNDSTLGIRLPDKLKSVCKFNADLHQTSLNQEILIRLKGSFDMLVEHAIHKGNRVVLGVKESSEYSFEQKEFVKQFDKLSSKNKHAVMQLIKNLSE
ncbi:MAG: hypothetical protein COA83_09770 [Methylophaga sp.]|nr:MAG: hypothetical protein COA83_09770 [Methylophaga sp.]